MPSFEIPSHPSKLSKRQGGRPDLRVRLGGRSPVLGQVVPQWPGVLQVRTRRGTGDHVLPQ